MINHTLSRNPLSSFAVHSLSKSWDHVQLLCGSLNYSAIAPQTLPYCCTVENVKRPQKAHGTISMPCPQGERVARCTSTLTQPCSMQETAGKDDLCTLLTVLIQAFGPV